VGYPFNLFGDSFCGGGACQKKEADRSMPIKVKKYLLTVFLIAR
jgi:hypothetical protein